MNTHLEIVALSALIATVVGLLSYIDCRFVQKKPISVSLIMRTAIITFVSSALVLYGKTTLFALLHIDTPVSDQLTLSAPQLPEVVQTGEPDF